MVPPVEREKRQADSAPSVEVHPMDEHNRRLVANVHPPAWQNPVPQGRYNLVIIGGGSAGLVAAAGAAGLGARVALVERHLLGGDCLNVGCVPSKVLIRSARAVGDIARAGALGIQVPPVSVDFAAVMERVRQVRAAISDHDSVWRFQRLGVDVYLGEGRFSGPDTVTVDGQTLRFQKALIATGSRPMVLPIPGLAEVGYLTNETLFELTSLPRRLAVIGAGPIGAELAQAFRRFGSQVILFDILPQVLGREDPDAAAIIQNVFVAEGIQLALGAQIQQVRPDSQGKIIDYELDGRQASVTVDEILVAVGRTPNLEGLNLEAAGIEYHKKGVQVSDTLQTTNPNVYAAGDIALPYQFTHTADAAARLVLQNALFPGPKQKVSALVVPWCTYTDPEVAHVGLYEKQAQEQGIPVETYVQPLGETDRGRADGETEGFVKVHVRKGSDRILGATIVARHAGEMINEITLAMVTGAGLKTLTRVIHPYPTQAEAIRKVADAYNRTRLTPVLQRILRAWFAWRR
ncbi:mercuric reductase [Litorilinea aerophila]|uniref:Mercuric reductase n=1 Tax=Litorilinea aerophila TaxID=1204385 RepID=A0A540VLY5_9CHLR